jgi:hypothetical protein
MRPAAPSARHNARQLYAHVVAPRLSSTLPSSPNLSSAVRPWVWPTYNFSNQDEPRTRQTTSPAPARTLSATVRSAMRRSRLRRVRPQRSRRGARQSSTKSVSGSPSTATCYGRRLVDRATHGHRTEGNRRLRNGDAVDDRDRVVAAVGPRSFTDCGSHFELGFVVPEVDSLLEEDD